MHPPSKDVGPKDIGNNMNMALDTRKSNFVNQEWFAVSYLVHYDTLLQNATDINTKCDKSSLQNASTSLLQNATLLLQIATVITKYVNFITKCDSHYKIHCLLKNVSVQSFIIGFRNNTHRPWCFFRTKNISF